VLLNIFVPLFYPGYSLLTFTVSELSAIGAPTRQLWVILVIPYILAFGAFGIGILRLAGENRYLRQLGWIIIFYTIFNVYWPPMHMRGIQPTLTDTLHILWASVTVVLMILMMGFGSVAFRRRFKVFTIWSIVLLLLFGVLTSLEAPSIPMNGPTPTIGIWERINIGIFLAWIIVVAVKMLKREKYDPDPLP
jgi:hypothetical protein